MLRGLVPERPACAPRAAALRVLELRGLPPVAERPTDPEPLEAPPAVALAEEPALVEVLEPLDPGPLAPEPPPGRFNNAEPRIA